MTDDLTAEQLADEIGVAFATACQKLGTAGFAMRLLENGNVRVIGLKLPPSVVAEMLRQAADGYEERAGTPTIN